MAIDKVLKGEEYIRRQLDGVRTFWLTVRFVESFLLIVALTVGLILVSFTADNAFTLPGWFRFVLLATILGVFFGGLTYRIVRISKSSPSDEAMARIVEKTQPGVDNQFINAIQLSKSGYSGSAGVIVAAIVDGAASVATKFDFTGVVTLHKMKKLGIIAGAILLMLFVYAFGMPEYFGNALSRYVRPLAYVPPLTKTHLEVEPGDTTVGYGSPVNIIAHVGGQIPPSAVILFRPKSTGKYVSQEMEFNGKDFTHVFSSVTSDVEYSVEAGDARSPRFLIHSVILPTITKMRMTVAFPAYSSLPPQVLDNASGTVSAPFDSQITIECEANVQLSKVEFVFSDGKTVSIPPTGKTFKGGFTVKASGWYSINLWDMDGERNDSPPKYSITAIPDKPPEIRIIRPDADVTTSPVREVMVAYQASDDFGITCVELCYRLNSGEEKVADKFEPKPGTKLAIEQFVWKMSAAGFKAGDKVSAFLRVKDNGPNAPVLSKIFYLLVVSEEDLLKKMQSLMGDLQTKLAEILALQKDARSVTDTIAALQDAGETDKIASQCEGLEGKQASVRLKTVALIQDLTDPMFETLLIKPTLQTLAQGKMVSAMDNVSMLKTAVSDATRKEAIAKVGVVQDDIIRELEKLLGRLPSILNALKDGKTPEQIADEFPEKKMEWFKQKLEEFAAEQRKVIEMTRELEKIPQEDWTDKEKEMQKELEKIEEKWQKFFEENRDDFSKIPWMDFSDGRQVDEFVEIYEAVTKAYEAIKSKGMEIAVPLEQAGLEKAEKLMHNIEAWLPDTPDREKWSMEEPPLQDEIPMAELPEEIEDIVGDLIESEDDMADDIEDITSSWSDSADEGAGWDCMDGPISNNSAKGKTGNRMPNKSEIAGRSGEGRSGKSSGEFVEKNATGKGGRETPTRLTPDPYEKGEVNDTSKDPVSGSTGGGKVSGQGGEGLQGPPPPDVKKEMGRLAGQQAEMLGKAENLLHELKKRHYPTKDVEKAIADLKEIEKMLREGAHGDISGKMRAIVEKLRDAQKVIDEQTKINRERRRQLPERDREGIGGASDEEVPPDYRDLVDEYYRSLAEGEGGSSSEEKNAK